MKWAVLLSLLAITATADGRSLLQGQCNIGSDVLSSNPLYNPRFIVSACEGISILSPTAEQCTPCLCSLTLGFAPALTDSSVTSRLNSGDPAGSVKVYQDVLLSCINTYSSDFAGAQAGGDSIAQTGLAACARNAQLFLSNTVSSSSCNTLASQLLATNSPSGELVSPNITASPPVSSPIPGEGVMPSPENSAFETSDGLETSSSGETSRAFEPSSGVEESSASEASSGAEESSASEASSGAEESSASEASSGVEESSASEASSGAEESSASEASSGVEESSASEASEALPGAEESSFETSDVNGTETSSGGGLETSGLEASELEESSFEVSGREITGNVSISNSTASPPPTASIVTPSPAGASINSSTVGSPAPLPFTSESSPAFNTSPAATATSPPSGSPASLVTTHLGLLAVAGLLVVVLLR